MTDQSDMQSRFPGLAEAKTDKDAFRHWRHERVPQLLEQGRTSDAITVILFLLGSPVATERDRLDLARLAEGENDPRAVEIYEELIRNGADAATLSYGLSRLLQAREHARAARLAGRWSLWPRDDRLTTLSAQALDRAGEADAALGLLDERGRATIAAHVEIHLRLLNNAGRHDEAVLLAKRAAKQGEETLIMKIERAKALQRLNRRKEAVAALGQIIETDSTNTWALLRRGELHLSMGNTRASQEDLAAALAEAPHLNKTRVALARSHKAAGEFGTAADLLLKAHQIEPGNNGIRKLAAAALNQVGRQAEANDLYYTLIKQREEALPGDFVTGIRNPDVANDAQPIPSACLDWAWGMRDRDRWQDREEWERRARWGAQADKLLYDWLECRSDRIEEILPLLEDLDGVDAQVSPLVERGRGMIVASAHIGLMFAGPLVLELLGFDNKWLASVPSVPAVGFASKLISTADQTEGQVVRKSVRALAQGNVLTVAVDGTMSMSAPRVDFAGQSITYSSFAARLSYKQKAPAIFAVPVWEDDRIGIRIKPLPDPLHATEIGQFLEDWRVAYLSHVEEILRDAPENLRFSGGLWRDVR